MKYIKLFMLMVAAILFTACSDEETYNTDATTAVEFEKTTMTVKENEGLIKLPVKITGKRNGMIRLTIKAEGVDGSSEAPSYVAAKESANGSEGDYSITTKTLVVKTDTITSEVMNFEIKVLDDKIMNSDRKVRFTLSVEGAKLGAKNTLDVKIENDERTVYDLLAGDWVMSYSEVQFDKDDKPLMNEDGTPVVKDYTADVTLSVIADDDSPLRGKQVLAYTSKFYLALAKSEVPLSWSFNYSYDEATKNGQLNFNCTSKETIFSTQGFEFSWQVVKNDKLADGEIKGKFTVDENNVVSKEITFDPNAALYISASGSGIPYVNLKLQRK